MVIILAAVYKRGENIDIEYIPWTEIEEDIILLEIRISLVCSTDIEIW